MTDSMGGLSGLFAGNAQIAASNNQLHASNYKSLLDYLLGQQNLELGNKGLDWQKLQGQWESELGNKNADNQFSLGNKGLDNQFSLGNKQADQGYDLGLGNLGLGKGQLDLGGRVADQNYDLGSRGLDNTFNLGMGSQANERRGQDVQAYGTQLGNETNRQGNMLGALTSLGASNNNALSNAMGESGKNDRFNSLFSSINPFFSTIGEAMGKSFGVTAPSIAAFAPKTGLAASAGEQLLARGAGLQNQVQQAGNGNFGVQAPNLGGAMPPAKQMTPAPAAFNVAPQQAPMQMGRDDGNGFNGMDANGINRVNGRAAPVGTAPKQGGFFSGADLLSGGQASGGQASGGQAGGGIAAPAMAYGSQPQQRQFQRTPMMDLGGKQPDRLF